MEGYDDFIKGFLAGDTFVLKRIYETSFPYVKKYILKSDGSLTDAEDVFQNALIHLFVKLKNKELEVKEFDRYLFTVCKNLWRKEIVKRRRVTNTTIFPLIDEEEERAIYYLEQSQWELYQEKFQLLSENCRKILKWVFDKKTYKEMVDAFSYSSETVARQRVFKCKKRLAELIKKDSRFNQFKKQD